MKHSLSLILLVASLAACARESSVAAGTVPAASGSAASVAAAPARPAPISAAASAAGDLAAAARTQQEGADTGTAADSGEAALERLAALPPEGQLPGGKWVAGTNYTVILPAQPTDVAPGKVEVIEMFWYGCPHCYALDPYVESWRKNKAPYIEFRRVHVTWSDVHRAHARLFYTLQALGKLEELHSKVFDEIHQKGDELYVPGDDKATLALQVRFAMANGISEADYTNAYNSFGVQTNVQKADELTRRYKIQSVPQFIIDGKYQTDVGMAGSQQNLLQVINDLAAAERHH